MSALAPNPPHDEAAAFVLHRESWKVETVARFTVDGEPASKSRPRFSRRGNKVITYTPEQTKAAERTMAWKFRQAAPHHAADDTSTFGVMAIFFHGTNQRRDVDNMLKLVCDGLNGVAWADDSQVVEISGRRGHDLKENARTEVWVYRVGAVPGLTKCARCGKAFRVAPSHKKRKVEYCSQECRNEALREARTKECDGCGEPFEVRHGARFCSMACKSKGRVVTVQCSECAEPFTMPRSTRAQVRNPVCGDECRKVRQERRDTYCVNGHAWATHGHRIPSGRRYCRECARIKRSEKK